MGVWLCGGVIMWGCDEVVMWGCDYVGVPSRSHM